MQYMMLAVLFLIASQGAIDWGKNLLFTGFCAFSGLSGACAIGELLR